MSYPIHPCEVVVSAKLLLDPSAPSVRLEPDSCGKPGTIKHAGVWFCEHHYDALFTPTPDDRCDW